LLDFLIDNSQNRNRQMKTRIITVVLCVLYFSMSAVIGALHDHAHTGLTDDHQCVACAWHLTGMAEIPVIVTLATAPTVEILLPPVESVFVAPFFSLASASRAPPATSA